ncbi:unnamed protein product [Owenia fusiformis]|uniref:Uncharacterized protein n=1 Tax=Owenia fusiformis TaxID=6347 RepID=A0A8J1YA81_OWEFU|nr:unnamed protein product [Owenia fusiformis]
MLLTKPLFLSVTMVKRQHLINIVFYMVANMLVQSSLGHSHCDKRCENQEVSALRSTWRDLGSQDVPFEMFVRNLLHELQQFKELEMARTALLALIEEYNDCMRTCEVPHSKRNIMSSPKSLKLAKVIEMIATNYERKVKEPQTVGFSK